MGSSPSGFQFPNFLCAQRAAGCPLVVAHFGRKTVRLSAALELIGFALGEQAGARLARGAGSGRQRNLVAATFEKANTYVFAVLFV